MDSCRFLELLPRNEGFDACSHSSPGYDQLLMTRPPESLISMEIA